jgi:hypothetical protein
VRVATFQGGVRAGMADRALAAQPLGGCDLGGLVGTGGTRDDASAGTEFP